MFGGAYGSSCIFKTSAMAALTEEVEQYPNGYLRGANQFRRR